MTLESEPASGRGPQVDLPDFAYQNGLRPGVDLADTEGMAQLLGETSR